MLASCCTENQHSTGKGKVAINVHCMNANFLAVGDTTYAYYFSLCYSVFLFVVLVCFLFCCVCCFAVFLLDNDCCFFYTIFAVTIQGFEFS